MTPRSPLVPRITVPHERIERFCRHSSISEFAFFRSVLRDDFSPDSDVDILVAFAPGARHSLFDLVHMEDELREIFGRDVDLVTRPAVERSPSAWRRQSILGSLSHVALAS